jgi:AcrR family transcriptional regulator
MIAGVASGSRPYHHGNLRPALISAAIGEIEESGPAAMSLRAVARRAGVTHAAATYHFGDRAGLLTAVAAEGYRLLAEALRGAQETRGSFLEVGVAYVRFAVTHRAHFEVMYRPELYHRDDAELGRAREAAATLLYGTGEITRERMAYGVAAWSIVHGLATLWLNGNLPAQLGDDPEEITRVVAAHLDPPRQDPALAARQPGKASGGRIADSTRGAGKLMPYVRAGEETPAGSRSTTRTTAPEAADGHDRRQRRPASVTAWAARKPGALFADAPVPGSKDLAGRSQLLLLAPGAAAAANTVGPLSGIIGRKTA